MNMNFAPLNHLFVLRPVFWYIYIVLAKQLLIMVLMVVVVVVTYFAKSTHLIEQSIKRFQ